jgi:hypothetical protein
MIWLSLSFALLSWIGALGWACKITGIIFGHGVDRVLRYTRTCAYGIVTQILLLNAHHYPYFLAK